MSESTVERPIDMVLFCPACGAQHVDEPDGNWTNPPHRSHLCHDCGHIWRPADVPTNGVAAVKTCGSADHPLVRPLDAPKAQSRLSALEAENARLREALEAIAECSCYTRSGGAMVDDLGSYEAGLDKAIALANAALPRTPGGDDAEAE